MDVKRQIGQVSETIFYDSDCEAFICQWEWDSDGCSRYAEFCIDGKDINDMQANADRQIVKMFPPYMLRVNA